jgi:cytosine/adenosine deaminase-related metal-dependent hydrolase
VAVDLGGVHVAPVVDPVNALVWRAHASDVWASVVDGRLVVDERRYLAGDEEAIVARAVAAIDKVTRIGESSGILGRAK